MKNVFLLAGFILLLFSPFAQAEDNIVPGELIILGSGKDVPALIKEFDGKITKKIGKTDMYVVQFPVSNRTELDAIKEKLNKKGVQAVYNFRLTLPDDPHAPQ